VNSRTRRLITLGVLVIAVLVVVVGALVDR
jgi:hypothetical protein